MNAAVEQRANDYRRWKATQNLLSFCRFVIKDYQTPNHHKVIARYLDQWIAGKIKRLMIFSPPRHGKSLLVSQALPALVFGQNPDAQIIGASHTKRLATKLAVKLQKTMDSAAYSELFPNTALKRPGKKSGPNEFRKSDEFNIIGHNGKFSCYGVGGAIVGDGFEYGIIDDPISGREEAYSPVQREKVNDWYSTEFTSRMAPGARILIMHQRWHVQDLAGWLLQLQTEDEYADKWTVVSFSAVTDPRHTPTEDDPRGPNEPLWPVRYPMEYLNARKAENTETDWLAIYQQRPTAEGGNHFKTEWFDTFWVWRPSQGDPKGRIAIRKRGGRWQEWSASDCSRYGMVDPAATNKPSSDHTAMGAFLQTPDGDLVVLDIRRDKIAVEKIPERIKAYGIEHNLLWIGVEANGFQVTLVHEARRLNACPLREISHRGKGKLVRATPAIIMANNGQVVLPQDARWTRGFLERLSSFTGMEGDDDDECDCLAYAALEMNTRGGFTAPPPHPEANKKPDPPKGANPIGPVPKAPPQKTTFGFGG